MRNLAFIFAIVSGVVGTVWFSSRNAQPTDEPVTSSSLLMTSEFCGTEFLDRNDDPNSAIFLTVENVDETSMIIEIESATNDPVDRLVVNNGGTEPPFGCAPCVQEGVSEDGKLSVTIFWGVPPAEVSLNLLWSNTSFPGNVEGETITVPFTATCDGDGGGGNGGGDCVAEVYENFDEEGVLTNNFINGDLSEVDNPGANDVNGSVRVAQYVRSPEAFDVQIFNIAEITDASEFTSGDRLFVLDMYTAAPVGTTIRIQLENNAQATGFPNGIHSIYEAVTTTQNEWEKLTFTLNTTIVPSPNIADNEVDRVVFLFNPDAPDAVETYFYDNFGTACPGDDTGGGGGMATNVVDFPVDFECEFTEYNFQEFGGAPTMVVDNPFMGAGNMSAKVAQMEKVGGEFAGAFIDLEDPIDFSISSVIKLNVYSPKANITVRLKIEDSTNGSSFEELDATITTANAWEELSFDFSGTNAATRSLDRVVLFFDFAVVGDGSFYYFDDIVQEGNNSVITCEDDGTGGGMATNVVDFPVDFECEFTEYNFQEFGGAPTIVVDNPFMGAGNMSAKVAQMEKVGGEFAGAFIDLEDPIDFSISSVIKLNVYSPKANITVRLKIEDSTDGGSFEELDATITTANAWEELSFDFSGTSAATRSLDRVVLFFDFAVVGDGSFYYFDDIVQEGNNDVIACEDLGTGGGGVGPNSIVFPVDFECEFIENYIALDFEGTFTQIIDNPFAGAGNMSPKVAQTVKGTGAATFAGTVITLAEPVDFDISTQFTVNVWSPKVNSIVKFQLEEVGNGGNNESVDVATTVADQWQTLTFDFGGKPVSNARQLQNIVIFFDFDVPGDGASYFFDDIIQVGNTGMTDCQAPTEPAEDAFRPPVCETAIAVYSNTYPQLEGTNFNAFAGSTTISEVQIDGNDIFRYDNFDFQGIQLDPALDASELTNLHVDVWSVDLETINIFPISPGPAEKPFELVLTPGEWSRFDIPLSEFADVVDLSNIFQFKFDGGTGTETVYIDNIYVNGACYIPPTCPELVWADEFDGTELNLEDWTYELGDGCPELCGWGNQELQFYREENTTVADGILTITAKEESFGGYDYTSSRIVTKGKQDFTYGRMEASIKVPEGQGIWPAFWMFHSNGEYGVWPLSGEIDIMEYLGQETDRIFGTIHHGDLFPNNRNTSGDFRLVNGGFNERFYKYAIEWEENIIRWYVDDYLYLTLTPDDIAPDFWSFNQDFHFLLNVAVGGTLPGPPDASTTFPQAMEVDYVRVYRGRFPHLTGAQRVDFMTQGEVYTVNNGGPGSTYNWTVEGGEIVDGQGTNQITVNWGTASQDATVSVDVTNECGVDNTINLNVAIDVERVAVREFSFENFDDEALVEFVFSDGTYEDNVANPAPDDLNSSALVGKYTRNDAVQFDVLVYDTEAIMDAGEFTSGSKTFFVDIYTDAPVGTPILLQLENSTESEPGNFPTGRHSRYETKTTVQSAWERLAFEFKDRPDGITSDFGIDQIIILFNSDSRTGDTFFYDNLDKYCTDEEGNCFDGSDFALADPCNCNNPKNITLTDGSLLLEDTLKIDASSFVSPVITFVEQDGNLLDANGTPLTAATASFIPLGGGEFGLQFYKRTGVPISITIDVNGQERTFTADSCPACIDPTSVPTLTQWGLFLFGLLVINLGLIFLYQQEKMGLRLE